MLAIGYTKNPDFALLDLPQLVFRLAGINARSEKNVLSNHSYCRFSCCEECRLCLVRLHRTAWQIDQNGQEPTQTNIDGGDEDASTVASAETMQTTLHDMLEETRRLYQVRTRGPVYSVLSGVLIECARSSLRLPRAS